jgi:hypothetical protein
MWVAVEETKERVIQKSCGICMHWIKLGAFKGRGICDKHDYGWCGSDHYCDDFKKIKKKPKKQEIPYIIVDEWL